MNEEDDVMDEVKMRKEVEEEIQRKRLDMFRPDESMWR